MSGPTYIEGEIVLAESSRRDEVARSEERAAIRGQIAGRWILSKQSNNTKAAYRRDLGTFFAYCDEFGIDALTVQQELIDGYREFLTNGATGTTYTKATIARKLSAVSSFYEYAARRFPDIVRGNPLKHVERPRTGKAAASEWLERDEVGRLLAVADATGPWEAALFRVMIYTGVRVSELCAARASDLRAERGHLTLLVQRKGGTPERVVIPADGAAALDAYLAGRRAGPLFTGRRGGPLTRDEVTYRLRLLVQKAGVKKTITPHSLRHTAATMAREAGRDIRDVQKLLGHARIETTLRYEHARTLVEDSAAHDVARYVRGEA